MANRDEELQNLKKMQTTLHSIIDLNNRKEKTEKSIEKELARRVNTFFDYPMFSPSNFKKQVEDNIAAKAKKRSVITSLIMTLPTILFYIIAFVVLIALAVVSIDVKSTEIISEIFEVVIVFMLFYSLPLLITFIPRFGLPISAAIHVLGGAFWTMACLVAPLEDPYQKLIICSCAIFWIGAVVVLISYAIWWIINLIAKAACKKKNDQMLHQAEIKDAEEEQAYDAEEKAAKVAFQKQQEAERIALSEKVKQNVYKLKADLAEITKELEYYENYLNEIPGLAPQDKSLHTVSTLISYFERGKADSIKEAINIFDNEQTLEMHLELQRRDRLREADERRATLKRIAEEQEYHNERMREKADEYNKKIDRAIDEIKNGNS